MLNRPHEPALFDTVHLAPLSGLQFAGAWGTLLGARTLPFGGG